MSLAMPFIDNDLLWCPDNDGKMVDLSSCLQVSALFTHQESFNNVTFCLKDAASVAVGQQTAAPQNGGGLGELSQSDLSSLVPPIQEGPEPMPDTEDIFKQLSETSFEIDNFLNEFNTSEIKVSSVWRLAQANIQKYNFQQEENNNNIPNSNNEHPAHSSASHQKSAHVTVEMRSLKFTIAAANPLLAEKLAQPTGQLQQLSNQSSSSSRPQIAPLVPKVEKGK